jgi:hypothetical protein
MTPRRKDPLPLYTLSTNVETALVHIPMLRIKKMFTYLDKCENLAFNFFREKSSKRKDVKKEILLTNEELQPRSGAKRNRPLNASVRATKYVGYFN